MGNGNDEIRRERRRRPEIGSKIDRILIDVQRKLRDSYAPEALTNLNSFERKRIHRFFDDKPDFETKTYRKDDDYVLKVFPVGNIKRLAREKAEEALKKRTTVALPPMGSFERYIVHDSLKDYEEIETKSTGEGLERFVEIHPAGYGRGLKRIIKKIKLF